MTEPTEQAGPRWLLTRLSVMMAAQYAALGLWAATVNTYIDHNTGDSGLRLFSAGFIGFSATAGAIGALVSPLLLGIVADRYFSTEKILAALHLICAVCLQTMCVSRSQSLFYVGMIFFYQAYLPTITLSNSLALRHLPNQTRQFPLIRAIGTAGWVVAGLVIGFAWPAVTGKSIEATLVPLRLAIAMEIALAVYCLTLPPTPAFGRATRVGWRTLTGGATLWRNRSFLIFLAVSALVGAASQFYNNFINPFLNHSGFEHAAAKMTLGQVTEVLCMIALPVLVLRLSLRQLLLIGTAAWACRFAMLACCDEGSTWLAYPSIAVHGLCYTFVYLTGQLYADELAEPEARSAAQGLHTLVISGFGHFAGALLAQWAQAKYLTPVGVHPPPYEWSNFWLAPLAVSCAALVVFTGLLFDGSKRRRD